MGALLRTSLMRTMKPDDLIMFITEEAQHPIINDECMKTAESTLATLSKKPKAGKQRSKWGKKKSASSVTCK